jgi:hypothetical protein
MLEMIRRGNGFRDLACRQAVDLAIQSGRGNVDLLLPTDNIIYLASKLARGMVTSCCACEQPPQ